MKKLSLAALALALASSSSIAGEPKGMFFKAGLGYAQSKNSVATKNFTSKKDGSGYLALLGAGYRFNKTTRLEFELVRTDGLKSKASNIHKELTYINKIKNITTLGLFNVAYDFAYTYPLVPYISMGLGFARNEYNSKMTAPGYSHIAKAQSSRLAINGGMGVGYKFDTFALDLGYRYINTGGKSNMADSSTTFKRPMNSIHTLIVGTRFGF
jgi:opacity protein-like surface antigen